MIVAKYLGMDKLEQIEFKYLGLKPTSSETDVCLQT